METVLDMKAMLNPILGDNPSGADLSFSNEFDEIKEARRAEEDLPQDQWETKLKAAEWPKVKRLTSELLTTRTKDLQLAAWLTESITELHGFAGLFAGLSLTQELLSNFWDTLHPSMVDGISIRGGKIAWINSHLPTVIVSVPVTAAAAGSYGLRHWNEAKEIENVARRDAAAARRMVEEEGRASSEVVDKAIADTPAAFYKSLYEDVTACQNALLGLEQVIDSRFAGEAPSLSALKGAVEQCVQLITRLSRSKGVLVDQNQLTEQPSPGEVTPTAVSSAPAGSRQEALKKLAEAAQYFRSNEPHSPVAYLVDRAVRWGGMSFDHWLEEVVKDPGQLQSLYELLGIKRDQGS